MRLRSVIPALNGFLRDNMDIDRWSIAQKFVDRGGVEKSPPPMRRGAPEDNFGNVFFANKLGDRCRYAGTLQAHNLRPYVLREAKVAFQALLVCIALVVAAIDIHNKKLRSQALGHARGSCNQVLRCRIRADAHCDAFTDGHASLATLLVAKGLKVVVDGLRYMTQREFAQSDQISLTEEVLQRAFRPVHRVDIAAPHAPLQRLGREIGHHHFIDPLQNPVGYSFSYRNSSQSQHGGGNALQMLNVQG